MATVQQTILSDSKIKQLNIQKTILSDSQVNNPWHSVEVNLGSIAANGTGGTTQRHFHRTTTGKLIMFVNTGSVQYRTSIDNGATWSGWTSVVSCEEHDEYIDSNNNIWLIHSQWSSPNGDVYFKKLTWNPLTETWTIGSSLLIIRQSTRCSNITISKRSDGNVWVACAQNGTNTRHSVYSTDGVTWTSGGTFSDLNSSRFGGLLLPVGSNMWHFGGQYDSITGNSRIRLFERTTTWTLLTDFTGLGASNGSYSVIKISDSDIWLATRTSSGIKVYHYTGTWNAGTLISNHANDSSPYFAYIGERLVLLYRRYYSSLSRYDLVFKRYISSTWDTVEINVTGDSTDDDQPQTVQYHPDKLYFYWSKNSTNLQFRKYAIYFYRESILSSASIKKIEQKTINSDTSIVTRSLKTINSNAQVIYVLQKNLLSNSKVVTQIVENLTSDSNVKYVIQEDINSDVLIKINNIQNQILADSKVVEQKQKDITSDTQITHTQQISIESDSKIIEAREQKNILSDSTVKIDNVQKDILSNSSIKQLNVQQDILSDANVTYHWHKYINSDANVKGTYLQTIDADSKVVKRYLKTINSDTSIRYFKDFYARCQIEVEAQKDFYLEFKVLQPTPANPTGLTCSDLQTGEALELSWSGSNYGWNVYRDIGGVWTKQNLMLITSTSYIVGGLASGVLYTFKVKGVNGEGTESSGVTTTGTPTFNFAHYNTKPSWKIYIDSVEQTDAILERVELTYGPSFSLAYFYIPKNPSTPGLPSISKQEVIIYINDRKVFTGYLTKCEKVISPTDLRVSYVAVSKLYDYTLDTIDKNYNEPKGDHVESIDVTKVLKLSSCPYDLPSKLLYGLVSVADCTKLDLMSNMLRYEGNYKIYCDPEGTVNYYKIGSPLSKRTYEVGKHILESRMTEDITDKIDQVTVKSDYIQYGNYNIYWTSSSKIWTNDIIGDRNNLNRNIIAGADGNLYLEYRIYAHNISNISVEALVNDKPTVTEFIQELQVTPGNIIDPTDPTKPLKKWDDGSTDGKFAVKTYKEFIPTWKSCSSKVDYDHYGEYAIVKIGPLPVRYQTNIKQYDAKLIVGNTSIPPEPVEREVNLYIMLEPIEYLPDMRILYTYQGSRISKTNGSGTIKRTYHDSITPYNNYGPNEYDNNVSEVNSYLQNRADSEFARLSKEVEGGSITVLGDETLDLRMHVNDLEVTRIVHDFTNGFLTHIDLTNEQFYYGEYVREQKEKQNTTENITLHKFTIVRLNYNSKMYKDKVGDFGSKLTTTNNPKSGVGIYGN